jgi:hypothetical protein
MQGKETGISHTAYTKSDHHFASEHLLFTLQLNDKPFEQ